MRSSTTPAEATLIVSSWVNVTALDTDTVAVAHIPILNSGNSMLRIFDFQTSCGCAGVFEDQSGVPRRIEAIEIAPGQVFHAYIRIMLNSVSDGENFLYQVVGSTTDAKQTRFEIRVNVDIITHGPKVEPSEAVIGTHRPGDNVSTSIQLYQGRQANCRITHVESSHPDHLSVTWIPCDQSNQIKGYLGRIEARPASGWIGPLDSEILIHSSNTSTPRRIKVYGTIIEAIAAFPSKLSLNGQTANSRTGRLLVRSQTGSALNVEIVSRSEWFEYSKKTTLSGVAELITVFAKHGIPKKYQETLTIIDQSSRTTLRIPLEWNE
jgi:hypothetical protein